MGPLWTLRDYFQEDRFSLRNSIGVLFPEVPILFPQGLSYYFLQIFRLRDSTSSSPAPSPPVDIRPPPYPHSHKLFFRLRSDGPFFFSFTQASPLSPLLRRCFQRSLAAGSLSFVEILPPYIPPWVRVTTIEHMGPVLLNPP